MFFNSLFIKMIFSKNYQMLVRTTISNKTIFMIQVYCEKGWKKRNEEKIRHFKTNKKLVTAELPLLATGLAYNTDTVKADTITNDQAAKTATATDETPTSKKTSDEITAAFQTGDETGLKYESVKVEKIAGMTKDIIRGVDNFNLPIHDQCWR